MKKKILVIMLVGMFILTASTTLSLSLVSKPTTEDQLLQHYGGYCILNIDGVYSRADVFCGINSVNKVKEYECFYEVNYYCLPGYRIEGYWYVTVRIGDQYVYNIESTPFDYTYPDIPPWIDEHDFIYIPRGYQTGQVSCGVVGNVWEWDGEKWINPTLFQKHAYDDCQGWFPREPKNQFFIEFLKNHLNLVPIIRLLLQQL